MLVCYCEGLYLLIAELVWYIILVSFSLLLRFIGWIEKPKSLPASISDVYLGGGKESPLPASQKRNPLDGKVNIINLNSKFTFNACR